MRKAFILKHFDPAPFPDCEENARYCFSGRYVGEWPDQYTEDYEILEIDAYDNESGELVFRHFVDFEKEEYWTYPMEDLYTPVTYGHRAYDIEAGKWSEARIDTVLESNRRVEHGDHDYICEWLAEQLMGIIGDAYKWYGHGPLSKLETWERQAQAHKAQHKYNVRLQNIREMFADLPDVEEEVSDWTINEIFPAYVLQRKTEKAYRLICSTCGKGWNKKERLKYGSETACPFCGKSLKATKKQKIFNKARIYKSEAFADGGIIRHFDVVSNWVYRDGAWKRNRYIEEVQRGLISKGGNWKRSFYAIDYTEEKGYTFADHKCYGVWTATGTGYLYPKDIYYPHRTITDLMMYRLLAEDHHKSDWNGNEFHASGIPEYTEYLFKSGLKKIALHVIHQTRNGACFDDRVLNRSAKNLPDLLRLDSNMAARIKRLDIKIDTLIYLQNHPEHISDQAIIDLDRIGADDLMLNETGLSITKALNYIKRQTTKCSFDDEQETKTIYRDYIRLAIENGEDPHDDIVRLCGNVRERHNALIEAKENQENKARFRKCKGVKKRFKPYKVIYGWSDEEYTVIVPSKPEDIFREGREQHHCVGHLQYMENHAEGKTLILFLRSIKDPKAPWYTLEVRPGDLSIKQRYSKYDRQPDIEVADKEISKWKAAVKKRLKRPSKEVKEALEMLKAM